MTLNDVIFNGNTHYLASAHLLCNVLCSLVVTCFVRNDFLALLYVMFLYVFVTFPYSVLGKVLYLVVSISDLCLLPFFVKNANEFLNIDFIALYYLLNEVHVTARHC